MSKKIIASGVGSEYVLGELVQYLRAAGWDVIEINFSSFTGDVCSLVEQYQALDLVYITSAHTNITREVSTVVFPQLTKEHPNYLSPLEFFQILKPKLSIFIPHEILSPYGEPNIDEFRFLDLFDYILAPYSAVALQAALGKNVKVLDAGWIKYTNNRLPANKYNKSTQYGPQITLFVTIYCYLKAKYGIKGFVEYFAPLLANKNVKIKLPKWYGVEEVEKMIEKHFPSRVIPAEKNSIDCIQSSDLVICNSISSIHAEASLMGCPAICLLDHEPPGVEEQKDKLSHLPNIIFHDYTHKAPIPEELISRAMENNTRKVTIKAFDFQLVEKIIQAV